MPEVSPRDRVFPDFSPRELASPQLGSGGWGKKGKRCGWMLGQGIVALEEVRKVERIHHDESEHGCVQEWFAEMKVAKEKKFVFAQFSQILGKHRKSKQLVTRAMHTKHHDALHQIFINRSDCSNNMPGSFRRRDSISCVVKLACTKVREKKCHQNCTKRR